jgi:hypothetical protein
MTDINSPEKRRSVINPARGRPFEKGQSGNPAGRPMGARNRATLAAQTLLDGQLEAITQKAAEQALQGDINAIRLCLQHGLPPRREQPIEFELKKLESIHDTADAVADVISAVSVGKITLGEGIAIVGLIEAYGRACRASQESSQSEIRALRVEEDRRLPQRW